MGAEFTALMASMAPQAAAAAPAAAAGAGGIAGGTAGLFGTAGAAAPSAMTQSLLAPMGAAGGASATPFFTEAAMTTGMGSDPTALAKALSPETFSLGAPPGVGKSMPWEAMALGGLSMMDQSQKPMAGLGQRPQGYQPQKSMQEQFAEIMGWLEQQGGRR